MQNLSQSFHLKASRRVSSFFLRVQLLQPYVTTDHTSAFISLVFVEIGMLWLFHIFCNDAPIACPLFNLVQNSVMHSPSSVITDPRCGNVFTCANCSFWRRVTSLIHPMTLLLRHASLMAITVVSSDRAMVHYFLFTHPGSIMLGFWDIDDVSFSGLRDVLALATSGGHMPTLTSGSDIKHGVSR